MQGTSLCKMFGDVIQSLELRREELGEAGRWHNAQATLIRGLNVACDGRKMVSCDDPAQKEKEKKNKNHTLTVLTCSAACLISLVKLRVGLDLLKGPWATLRTAQAGTQHGGQVRRAGV